MANRANVAAPISAILTDDAGKSIAQPALAPPASGVDTALQVHANLGSGVVAVAQELQGAPSMATAQATLNASTATLVLAARATRRSALITNLDTTIAVYVGNSNVTAGTGQKITAGNSLTIPVTAAIYAISASATPVVCAIEVYD